mmetsp:Transcript_115336/g.337184  ORF Transcript_115336/g.337184 Transcript_115336/m.337184 type:complete len:285 (-) Transcript_115336:883-1737(-)
MNVVLHHKPALDVQVLDLLGCHILPLRQFEEVLLPVDDLEAAIRRPEPDVAGVEPAVRVNGLCSLVWHLVVAVEYVRPSEANLTSSVAGNGTFASPVHLVRAQVAHVRDVLQPDLIDPNDPTNRARNVVIRGRERAHGHRLREAIALLHTAAEYNSQEVKHVVGNGCTAGDYASDPVQADPLLDLREDQPVPQRMPDAAAGQPCLLPAVRPLEKRELHAARLFHASAEAVVDAIEQPGHRGEDGWSQLLKILKDLESLPLVEANGSTCMSEAELDDSLEHVRQG